MRIATKAPVAFIIFNRPDSTRRVFREIARARPSTLFVIADGPRPDRPDDEARCAETRKVIDRVDWKCEVVKNYSDVNLGCGIRPASGIDWVFQQVEEAIILEDDCVPHPTFFRFCQELLERYREDERVMMISGSNHWCNQIKTPDSYLFSLLPWIWGWATWRRAWKHYDIEIKQWPKFRETSWMKSVLMDTKVVEYWEHVFDKAYAAAGKVDYWDYQWQLACWVQNGLCIYPNSNLIKNIGFGKSATHTKDGQSIVANMATSKITFPLRHPPCVDWDKEVHKYLISQYISNRRKPLSLFAKLRRKVSDAIPVSMSCRK